MYTDECVQGDRLQDILRQNLHQDTKCPQSETFLVHLHKHSNQWTQLTLVKRGNHGNHNQSSHKRIQVLI
jgi:hypothetical protein